MWVEVISESVAVTTSLEIQNVYDDSPNHGVVSSVL